MGFMYIKCPDCGIINTQDGICTECGAILNVVLRRQQEDEKKRLQRMPANPINEISSGNKFIRWGERHPSSAVRLIFSVLNAIWLFCAMVVGALIATVIAVAAG
jgi:hypothetical protein